MYSNYLIFFLSLITSAEKIEYNVNVEERVTDDEPYSGKQTNEAVTKFVVDSIAEKSENEKLNKIILLCSDEVKDKNATKATREMDMSSLDYYKNVIGEYLKEKGYTDIEDIIESIDYKVESNENENQIMRSIEGFLDIGKDNQKDDSDKKRVFIDFSGGFRSAALTLVFVGRILQKQGVELANIYYSKLEKDKKGVIEECTKTYNTFIELENLVKIDMGHYKAVDENSEINKVIKQLLQNVSEAVTMHRYDEIMQMDVDGIKESIEQKNLEMTSMDKLKIDAVISQIEESKKGINDPFINIMNEFKSGNYLNVVLQIRERTSDILVDSRIIKTPSDNWSDKLSESYKFYEKDEIVNHNTKATYMEFVKYYIQLLCKNKNKSPSRVKNEHFKNDFFKRNNYEETLNGKEFAWRRQGYNEYFSEEYKNNFKRGVRSLQKYYEENKIDDRLKRSMECCPERDFNYASYIDTLADNEHDKMIRILFPYVVDNHIHPDDAFVDRNNQVNEIWYSFMYEFTKQYNIVRYVRNNIVHETRVTVEEQELGREAIKRIITLIKEIREESAEVER